MLIPSHRRLGVSGTDKHRRFRVESGGTSLNGFSTTPSAGPRLSVEGLPPSALVVGTLGKAEQKGNWILLMSLSHADLTNPETHPTSGLSRFRSQNPPLIV